jgi:hypothetical protein
MDDIMRRVTQVGFARKVRRPGLCTLSASINKVTEMSEQMCSLGARAATTGLKFNSEKNTGATKTNSQITTNTTVNNVVIERAEQFTHLSHA